MTNYLIALITGTFAAAVIGILTPNGEGDGIAKHVRLITSLFLICLLVMPIKEWIQTIDGIINGRVDDLFPYETSAELDYKEQMEEALGKSSKQYFTQMLSETLQSQFSIHEKELRCNIQWKESHEEFAPIRVTVILSGSAIWKNPKQIAAFVQELLGCECITAIE